MTFTKEWLQQTIEEMEYDKATFPGDLNEDHVNVLEALKMALAGMAAEPSLHRWRRVTVEPYGPYPWHYGEFIGYSSPVDGLEDEYYYTAPQPLTTSEREELENYRNAQQVVPEAISTRQAMAKLEAHEPCDSINVAYKYGWNACRAAMQSGAVKDGWVACSERMPNIGVPVITCCGDVVQYAAYAWDGKEWQDWYEEYDKLPASTFTHWHSRPAAPKV